MPATWEDQARALVRPELTGDATLRAVLVHELIHAWDDASHGLTGLLAGLETLDAVMAMNAVIEGHAQFEARRVCERSGWTAGFDLLTATIGEVHESTAFLGETAQQALRIQAASLASAYRDGERFIAALHAAGGDELVARAFREPPDDLGTILHPDWYLDPAQRPALLFDAEPALDLFAARFPQDGWSSQRMSLQPVQVEAALALLPAERVRRVTESLRWSRALVLQPSADPTSRMVLLNVMEFAIEAAAQDFVAAAGTLAEIKDDRMKQDFVRSVDSERVHLVEADLAGFRQRLVMQSGPLAFEVSAMEAARGPLVVETIFSAEPIEDEAHLALVRELFGAVRRLEGD